MFTDNSIWLWLINSGKREVQDLPPLPEPHPEMNSCHFSLTREPGCPASVCQQKGLLGLLSP